MRSKQAGFTLVELVVGIVVMSIALVFMMSVLLPRGRESVEPVMQVKAAELAQALMNEILAQSFDDNSDHAGSRWRCGETISGATIPDCTTVIGAEESSRLLYDDVDDYDTAGSFVSTSGLESRSGVALGEKYPNFSVRIEVSHDAANFYGGSEDHSLGKRIAITIRLPQQSTMTFTAFRGNY